MPTPAFRKTRIAPTPSGFLHLGNVLSFAITKALAVKTGAKIFLRIDDVDRERTNKKYVQDIFDTLRFMNIDWDEGPRNIDELEHKYSQMCRMNLYNAVLEQLKGSGALFACTCSRADIQKVSKDHSYPGTCRHRNLPFDAENVCWRMHTDEITELSVKTLNSDIIKTTLPASVKDFVVRKKDGFPAYQLTSLVDDIHFGIDLVVRGEDLWPSTLAQQYLSLKLNSDSFRNTTFYHHPLILDAEGNKLSKSLGATAIQYFREQGKTPSDIYSLISAIPGFDAAGSAWNDILPFLRE